MPYLVKAGNNIFKAGNNLFKVQDTPTYAIQTITGFNKPYGVAFDLVTKNRVFITGFSGDSIYIYDLTTGLISTIHAGLSYAFGIVFDFKLTNNRFAVASYGSSSVSIYNAASLALTNTITGFPQAIDVAFDPVIANDRLLVLTQGGASPSATLSVLNATTFQTITTLSFDRYGFGVCFDPVISNNRFFVTLGEQIAIYDATTLSYLGAVNGGHGYVRADPYGGNNRFVVVNQQLYFYDSSTLANTESLLVFTNAQGVAFDTVITNNRIFVADKDANTLKIITRN
jgi:WD40 repeat protein